MAGLSAKKLRVTFEVYPDSLAMLNDIAQRHGLPDASKALRCLLDYAATDGDWQAIFGKIRCRRCG
ncbi:MAG: hypothetical protein FJX55_14025 [Alphaproteobacteria bacterium]|nr:hypothetical protein [Alphaproteobacteria bacterium]